MNIKPFRLRRSLLLPLLAFCSVLISVAQASLTLVEVYSFTPGGVNGSAPNSALIQGTDGYFYGVNPQDGASGNGTIFKLTLGPPATVVSVAAFTGASGAFPGANPSAALAQGADGNLYGTTAAGGPKGLGTVFSCSTNGLTPLWVVNFTGNTGTFPGQNSYGTLVPNGGDFYGTASAGGKNGEGTIFKISSSGSASVLASFSGAAGTLAGENPYAGLALAGDGYFYGTASGGGKAGYGTVFKINASGTPSNLASFGYTNGGYPYAGLIQANDGYLYGTSSDGGTNANSAINYGAVFRVTTNGVMTPLVTFNGANGQYPSAGLLQANDGYLYGTTESGGANGGAGTVFQMTTSGVLTGIFSFGATNGSSPVAGLIQASDGNLYGTTSAGGSGGGGTIFRVILSPSIISGPVNDIVGVGSNAGFTVNAGGGQPLTYQWFKNSTSIAGATNATLTLNAVTDSDAGAYDVEITNPSGAVTSAPATLTVVDGPIITAQPTPTSQTNTVGGSNTFSVTAGGTTPLNYQWFQNSAPIANATAASLTISNETTASAGSYQVVVSNPAGAVTSSVVTLTIIGLPLITAQPQSIAVNLGGQAVFSVTATAAGTLSYQWQTNSTPIPGATLTNLTVNPVTASSVASYMVVVTDAAGSVTSSPAILTILTPPFAVTEPASLITGPTAVLNAMVTANSSPISAWFQWGTNVNYNNQTPPVTVGAGGAVVLITNQITGLAVDQAYHFRVVTSNSVGLVVGADQVFAVSRIVSAWGDNSAGQTNVPSTLANVVALAGGGYFGLALESSGAVAAWGDNTDGQLNVPPGANNVTAIAGGLEFALALKSNGAVIGWGDNSQGQTNIPANLASVIAIAAGDYHGAALNATGNVTVWGSQTYVPAGLNNVVAIAAGADHNIALRNDGSVIAWGGANSYGETNVPAGLSNVVAIAAGAYHSVALKNDGTLVAWGAGVSDSAVFPDYGQSIVSGLTNVIAIAAGRLHTLALISNGAVTAFGYDGEGQTQVPPGVSNTVVVAAGGYFSLALATIPLPLVTTLPASSVTGNTAALNGIVSPNFSAATAYFQWGATTNYGFTTPPTNIAVVTGSVLLSNSIGGLTPLAVYHYQLVATNASGISYGNDIAFVALTPPTLTNVSDTAGGFQFQFSGALSDNYSVLISTDLVHWAVSSGTITPTVPGTLQFSDPSASASGNRFYEVFRGQR